VKRTRKEVDWALEDMDTCNRALQWWATPPEGYTKGYLLILILSSFSRGKRALQLVEDYLERDPKIKKKLLSLWAHISEKVEQIMKDFRTIEEIIDAEIIPRLGKVKENLFRVRHIAQDGDLIGDPEWAAESLQEVAEDFLLEFHNFFLVEEELRKNREIRKSKSYKAFGEKMDEIQKYFRKYFGYFHPVKNFLSRLSEREYGIKQWWLTRSPHPEDVQEEDIPKEVIKRFQEVFKASEGLRVPPCPEEELIIVHALQELKEKEDIRKVETHIVKCRPCLELFMDVRLAESGVMEPPSKSAEESFKELLRKYREYKKPR
jgi:hypothetical protein